ncbi:hypothetical protein HMPREF0208_04470 [Citrobacter koseri]|nr:hypothetical protein HMPREF3220_04754 [Citrobacter koseri]KWZ97883.1 hypothetical protein HMPREF3207_04380 [Citrobacter koseri]KXB40053.1 hypothetical protein HMPREF0208_04470 [Citrobacter koseri]
MNIYIFIKMKISCNDDVRKRRDASQFFVTGTQRDKKTGKSPVF